VEHTSEGVDALAGAIGARSVHSRNTQPPIKPQGISKGSNIKGIKVNWGQATTFINDRFEALQKSVGQLPKNKLAYDGPDMNYKPSTQKPLEPTKNQIEVRKYYPGSEPENSASGSASGKSKKASDEVTRKADDFSTGPFLPEEYYKNNYAPMQGTPGDRIDFSRVGSSGQVEKSRVIYDHVGKQKYRVDYSDHGNAKHPPNPPHLHEYIYQEAGKNIKEKIVYMRDSSTGRMRKSQVDRKTNEVIFIDKER